MSDTPDSALNAVTSAAREAPDCIFANVRKYKYAGFSVHWGWDDSYTKAEVQAQGVEAPVIKAAGGRVVTFFYYTVEPMLDEDES